MGFRVKMLFLGTVVFLGACSCHPRQNGNMQTISHASPGFVQYCKNELIHGESSDFLQYGSENAPLFFDHYYQLDNGNLLLLLGLPDYLHYDTNSFVPVAVSTKGSWIWGKRTPGAPSLLVKSPDQSLWMVTQWQVEASYPTLYRSMNGIDWVEIPLPENINVDCCFEYIKKVCFRDDKIIIRVDGGGISENITYHTDGDFLVLLGRDGRVPKDIRKKLQKIVIQDCLTINSTEEFSEYIKKVLTKDEYEKYIKIILEASNKIEYWMADLKDIATAPGWERIFESEQTLKKCSSTNATKGDWYRQENESEVNFYYIPGRLKAVLPRYIPK